MMNKKVFAFGAACAATLAIFAASDRIDVYNADGSFVSVMVDDIVELSVGKDASGDGYSTVNIVTVSGTKVKGIADLSDTRYTPLDLDKPHEISKTDAPNAKVLLLDCRNNTDIFGVAQIDPTKPADWRGCEAERMPHFLIKTDKGYASEYAISGVYTGKVYTDNPNFVYFSPKEMNLLGQDCLAFDMPFEPVHISATSVELETYKGQPFLGSYKGFRLEPGSNRISHKADAVLTADFSYNGTYVMKSTDEKAFDFLDLYDWDEATNTFAYVPYEGEMKNEMDLEIKTGVYGKFDNGVLFATFHDILRDIPENNVKYFAAKDDIEFTVAAADEYNNNVLVQAVPVNGGSARYFFYENRANYPVEVTMEYSFGSNIGADCTAFAVADGAKLFKYDYKGPGNQPVFTFRGAEYGSYNGAGDQLTLDGYDKCTLGSASGTYTIDGGLVSATIGGETRVFVVDRDARTYVEMISDVWDGKAEYTNSEAVGSFQGGQENNLNSMSIQFDKDFAGNDAPGTAAVRFTVRRDDGFSASNDAVASAGKYIYNAETNTIIITNLYMGTSATTSTRRNLVLKVSDDKLSMWVDDTAEDRIYGTGRDGSYLLTGQVNTLTATAPAVQLAPKYVANGLSMVMPAMGYPATGDATLEVNADAGTATLKITGMGTTMISATVDYQFDGATLTLPAVPTYTANDSYTMTPSLTTDIVFTVEADGSLKSAQTIGAVPTMGMYFDIDLSSVAFTVVE